MTLAQLLIAFLKALAGFTWGSALMLLVGAGLIYLGLRTKRETLLIPLGFGCILANLGLGFQNGILKPVYDVFIATGLLPILVLAGLGARLDFGRLFRSPTWFLISLAAQVGVFLALLLGLVWKLSIPEAAGLAAVGTANGPAAIFLAARSAPRLLPAIVLSVYLLGLAAAPLRNFALQLMVPAAERMEETEPAQTPISTRAAVLFPIGLTVLLGILFPAGIALFGALFFGNLLSISGVTDKLAETLRDSLYSIGNFLLGFFLGLTLNAAAILNGDLLKVLLLGSLALVVNICLGVWIGRVLKSEKRLELQLGLPGSGAEGLLASCLAGGILLVIASFAGL